MHVHGHRVRVKVPAQTRTVKVVRCHPRIVKRRVRVHGRWVIKRVVSLPREIRVTRKRIGFAASTTINGWLGTSDGNALAAQPVRILTAPDDGLHQFTQAATTTTNADGSWTARLPAGPSRLIRAVFDGTSTVEPAESKPASLVVPASVSLAIRPQQVRWGGKISITGRLRGGYLPAAGELVVLWIGWPGGSTEIGHLYTRRHGRFATIYTFLRGNGTITYRLWAATASESDYPYAPSRSRGVAVTLSP